MDLIVADVTAIRDVNVGDTAVLIGSEGDQIIAVEEMAAEAGTIAYDVLTGIGARVERVYIN